MSFFYIYVSISLFSREKKEIRINAFYNVIRKKKQKTNLKGVFAAGDCTRGHFQVVFATAEGARAGINANKYLRQLKKA